MKRKSNNPILKRRNKMFRTFSWIMSTFFVLLITSICASTQMSTYKRDFTNNARLYNYYLDSLAIEERVRQGLIADLQPFVSNPVEVADSLQALAHRVSPEGCIDGYDLAKIIWLESRFDSAAINNDTQALGLIQLLPSVISKFGWDYITILRSSPIEQLNYAETYIKHWMRIAERITKKKPHLKLWKNGVQIQNVTDLYLIIHYPRSFVYQDTVLYSIGTKAYAFNSGLDYNNDFVVDRQDVYTKISEAPID